MIRSPECRPAFSAAPPAKRCFKITVQTDFFLFKTNPYISTNIVLQKKMLGKSSGLKKKYLK